MQELIAEGDNYIENKDYSKAIYTYLKCLEISDSNYVNLKLCYLYILVKNYEIAFYYFINSYKVDSDYINIDYNLGIYLFSLLIKLPEEFFDDVKNMDIEDLRILETDLGYEDIKFQNKIRKLIIEQNFNLVKEYLIKNPNFLSNTFNLITNELITEILKIQKDEKKYLLGLIRNNDYQEVFLYLNNVNKYRKLNINLEYALKVVKELINIKENLILIDKVKLKTNSFYDAIDCKDYEMALQLEKKYCYNTKIDINNDILYLLLSEIVKEIKAIESASQEDIFDMDLGEVLEFDGSNLESNLDCNLVFSNIVKYLNNNDLYNVYKEIDNFLISINKVNYRFLIIDLIKLGDLDKVKKIIEDLIDNTYEFSIGEYINSFYISLSKKKYLESRVYLDIIKNAWKLGYDFQIAENLGIILDRYDNDKGDNSGIKLSLTNKKNKL